MPSFAARVAITVAAHDATAARRYQPGFGAEPLPPIDVGISVLMRSLRGPETSQRRPSVSRAVAAFVTRALPGSVANVAVSCSIALRTPLSVVTGPPAKSRRAALDYRPGSS